MQRNLLNQTFGLVLSVLLSIAITLVGFILGTANRFLGN